MRAFDYSKLKERTWDNEILAYVAQIHEYKGKQEGYAQQKPVELQRLVEIARIQSTEVEGRLCHDVEKIQTAETLEQGYMQQPVRKGVFHNDFLKYRLESRRGGHGLGHSSGLQLHRLCTKPPLSVGIDKEGAQSLLRLDNRAGTVEAQHHRGCGKGIGRGTVRGHDSG